MRAKLKLVKSGTSGSLARIHVGQISVPARPAHLPELIDVATRVACKF
jgi:hypothetical protein